MQIIMLKPESIQSQEWVPFVTQQQRLRNLIQILGYNLHSDPEDNTLFYYTLHLTTMCAPFYTSEKVCGRNPKWAKVDVCSSIGSAKAVVIRLWETTNNHTNILFVWAIELNGLLYIPPKQTLASNMFLTNSLIFCMTGGNFAPTHCMTGDQPTLTRITDLTLPGKDIKKSGSLVQLTRMHGIQRITSKQREEASLLKDKVSQGAITLNGNSVGKHQSATIRKLMNKEISLKPSRQSVLSKRKEIELVKCRVLLLCQEKSRKIAILRNKTQLSKTLYEQNSVTNSKLNEINKKLSGDIHNLTEMNAVSKLTETLCAMNKQLSFRKKELVSELNYIYPITEINENISICNIHLPDSENFDGCNDVQLNVGFGYVAHLVQMTAYFLNIPLRYPINHFGSRSKIIDHISLNMQDRERMFPLFGRAKARLEFNYGVYLLNKNIAQLRWQTGYITNDLRMTLYNCLVFVQPQSSFLKLQLSRRSSSNTSLESSVDGPARFPAYPNINYSTKMKHSLSHPLLCESKPNDSHNDVHHSS